jgi:hypothetical protein
MVVLLLLPVATVLPSIAIVWLTESCIFSTTQKLSAMETHDKKKYKNTKRG